MEVQVHNKFYIEKRVTIFLLFWSHHLAKHSWNYYHVELLRIGRDYNKLELHAKILAFSDDYITTITKKTCIKP